MLRSLSTAAFLIALAGAPAEATAGSFMDGAAGGCFLCEFFAKSETRAVAKATPAQTPTAASAPAAGQALNAGAPSNEGSSEKVMD